MVLLFTLCGCTRAAFMAANLPTYFDNITVVHDLAYGPDSSQALDIYASTDLNNKQVEVIIFLYGGRWTHGTKDDYRFVGVTLAKQGYLVVIPDYRKYPSVRFPRFVQDSAKALAWVSDHIAEFHGDPERIHVLGHSAGAHIGALLTADPHYLADEGKDRSRAIYDFIGLAGPYAFTPDEPDLEDMFGPPQNYPYMQVTTFIDGAQSPMLLLYGDEDRTVKFANLQKLEQRIMRQGGCVRSRIYSKVNHTDLVGALSRWNLQKIPIMDDMRKFFDSCHSTRRVMESHGIGGAMQ
ncbi:MAG: alpha/beta hydrolase [Nitrospira sp.]